MSLDVISRLDSAQYKLYQQVLIRLGWIAAAELGAVLLKETYHFPKTPADQIALMREWAREFGTSF